MRDQLLGFGVVEEVGDLVAVGVPRGAGLRDLRVVARLGGLEQSDRAEDVLAQQGGEAVAGGLTVVGLDRVADVGLVAKQPALGRLEIGQSGGEADDRQPRPGDVVLPELSHRVVECRLSCREGGGLGSVLVGGGRMRVRTGRCDGERRADGGDRDDRSERSRAHLAGR